MKANELLKLIEWEYHPGGKEPAAVEYEIHKLAGLDYLDSVKDGDLMVLEQKNNGFVGSVTRANSKEFTVETNNNIIPSKLRVQITNQIPSSINQFSAIGSFRVDRKRSYNNIEFYILTRKP